jgi:xylitol oxidase
MAAELTNWAGNVEFAARELLSPASIGELQDIVASNDRVRALGAGHSFNRIADTTGVLVSLDKLPRLAEVDTAARTVRVGGGVRLAELCVELRRHGLALPNLPSTPHFSVAGAFATGTHGSGDGNGTLAAAVSAVELVTADGSLVVPARGDEDFEGAVTSLGALGIVTALTLDLLPGYEVEQYVWVDLPWSALTGQDHLDGVFSAAYSVSAFTDWEGPPRLFTKRRTADPRPDLAWTGARPAEGPSHPIEGMPVANATEQLGVPGPWDERLPHFRAGFMPSVGHELQSEYFVGRPDAARAVQALRALQPLISPVLQISEIRTIAADTAWLSPSHGRDSVAFHFTWIADPAAVAPVLVRIEEALAPFGVRPHWGKLSSMDPGTVRSSYEHADRFGELLRRFDPVGKFRNELIDGYFPAAAGLWAADL